MPALSSAPSRCTSAAWWTATSVAIPQPRELDWSVPRRRMCDAGMAPTGTSNGAVSKAWTTVEFGEPHARYAGAVLAYGTEPKAVVIDVGSSSVSTLRRSGGRTAAAGTGPKPPRFAGRVYAGGVVRATRSSGNRPQMILW